ncbi:glycosyltransferase family 2 protein [Spirochaeta thermophila]|uniref:Glycosyl transferase, group 2 n=1 Tax=Winmispira thermophila (strain ATCC 49972 / DSM 6192 / RI 19.B1) TaxID=665571 RepID=E0RN35_WINT6|nr:glycosyltransferase family 2 protein [Spirochaeta thermophila]ADN02504.1 glycosyl transferase, group 2 [Spirochaeta thermophila DSM 6192]
MESSLDLSVIIPHFDCPELLYRLLSTIPPHPGVEVIVVDDNSEKKPDPSRLSRFPHVVYYENTSGKKGAGTCRNIGLEHAKGRWVIFADADDIFLPGFYSIVAKYFTAEEDVIFFVPTSRYSDSGEPGFRHEADAGILLRYLKERDHKSELLVRYYIAAPWSKLIRRDFIEMHGLRFDEVLASNDVMFATKLGYHMKRFQVSPETIYCVMLRHGSLVMRKSREVIEARIDTHIRYVQFLKSHLPGKDARYVFLSRAFKRSLGLLNAARRIGVTYFLSTWFRFIRSGIPIVSWRLITPSFVWEKITKTLPNMKRESRFYTGR